MSSYIPPQTQAKFPLLRDQPLSDRPQSFSPDTQVRIVPSNVKAYLADEQLRVGSCNVKSAPTRLKNVIEFASNQRGREKYHVIAVQDPPDVAPERSQGEYNFWHALR